MIGVPATKEAYDIFHRGMIALAAVEEVGFAVDMDYLDKEIVRIDRKVKLIETELRADPIYTKWKRKYGEKTKLGGRDQLADILFNEMGYECKEWTEGRVDAKTGKRVRRPKADEIQLKDLNNPFVDKCLQRDKLVKTKNTFLLGIKNETCNGRLHSFFNLVGGTSDDLKGDPRTYRSSSDSPNLHNFPTRDEESGKSVRTSFIPTDDNHVLIEADFKGIEVSVGYCYHKDPTMKKYLLDKTTDMHRDMAAQCYKIRPDQVNKQSRYCAKNKFVFPQFYGDYWLQCAKNLWDDIRRMKLQTTDGVGLYEHLKSVGITKLGEYDPKANHGKNTFIAHIRAVEDDFWKRRFSVYNDWKNSWYDRFVKRGYFQMKTGFVCTGTYNKKQVINYPVQGAAFHCLLWSLIRLERWLRENGMKTRIVSQIHDSMILDAPRNEVHKVVAKLKDLLTKELLDTWKWLIIPLEIEIDIAPKNWHKKESYDAWCKAN